MTSADKIAEVTFWRREVRERARAIVGDGGHGEDRVRLAQILDRFPDLSLDNAVMVLLQRPDATKLRRWHQWIEQGRRVRHGETAVRLLLADEDPPAPASMWSTTAVFDISQTDEV